jgi:hypothetical protein
MDANLEKGIGKDGIRFGGFKGANPGILKGAGGRLFRLIKQGK